MTTLELYREHVLGNYGEAPLTLVRGEGTSVWDDTGKVYLDFASGIAVNALGHAHPHWVKRVSEQAGTLVHVSNLYRNPNQGELAAALAARAGPGKVFLCNSGTEANEALLKLARLHGRSLRGGEEGRRYKVVTAADAFHGRTFGGMSATPQEKIQGGFRPLLDGFSHAPLNDLPAWEEAVDDDTAAVLVEPVQGESGINVAAPDFLAGLRRVCDQRGALLLFDEVQCGGGRTGKYFAWEHAGIRPDGIAMAKGLGGGFPIGAIWVAPAYAELFTPGSHGCTFGGSPLACAAALAVQEVIDREGLIERVGNQSANWIADLCGLADAHPDHVAEVRGIGYLVAVALKGAPAPVVAALREAGLLAVPAGNNAVRLLPPLNVSEEDLRRSVEIFDQVLAQLEVAAPAT